MLLQSWNNDLSTIPHTIITQKCVSQDSEGEVPDELTQVSKYYSDDLPYPLAFPTEYAIGGLESGSSMAVVGNCPTSLQMWLRPVVPCSSLT